MKARKQNGTGIIASILIPTLATILGGIVLLHIEYRGFHQTGDTEGLKQLLAQNAERQKEIERLTADLQSKNRRIDQLAQDQKEMEMLIERQKQRFLKELAEQKQRFLDQLAEQEKESARQKQRLAEQVIEQQKELEIVKEDKQRRINQVIEQRNEIEKLKSELVEMKRSLVSKSASAAKPPETVLLYYRVSAQRCRQVEYARIDEVTTYLRSLHISYVRGREYKDSGLSPLRVPLALKPIPWTSYDVKNVGHRDRVVSKMADLGIETATARPDDIDD